MSEPTITELDRNEGHRLAWESGMCRAHARNPEPMHGDVCREWSASLALARLEGAKAMREAAISRIVLHSEAGGHIDVALAEIRALDAGSIAAEGAEA